jgi:two-component system cell cycle sensor histidine kinase PleC
VLEASASGNERGKADRIYFNLTFRDITARKSTEHALRKAAAIAIQANEAKSAHLANMSHELRTPLNAIIGFSEMMLRGVYGPMRTKKYIDYTKDIHSSGKHLISVIDDILDLARIEAGRQELRPTVINLRDLFDDCVRIICGRAGRLDFSLTCELGNTDWFLFVDRRLLMQAILNLLANSINYADKNVEIRLRAGQEENLDLVIEIEDTGWGISKEMLATVVKPFEQIVLDKMPRDRGSGLGLSLVTAYAELHGGSFEIESKLNEGTIARIRLPSHVIQGSNRRDFSGPGAQAHVGSGED